MLNSKDVFSFAKHLPSLHLISNVNMSMLLTFLLGGLETGKIQSLTQRQYIIFHLLSKDKMNFTV